MARKRQTVRLDGVEDLQAALKRLSEDVQGEALRGAVAAGAEIVRDVASQLAPQSQDGSRGHEPGFLSHNIKTEAQWTRTQDTAMVDIGATKEAFYGPQFQERGTVYHPAQPFLRPALDETKESVVDEIRDRLRDSIMGGIK